MTRFDFGKDPHRRYDPLHDRWVLVSPQRTQRPWQGQQETRTAARRPTHDPSCYLCPGNERANGARNPDYQRTFVFTNDFAALRPETGEPPEAEHPLLRQEAVEGSCRVICFSPRHDLTLAEMTRQEIRRVVDVWNDQLHDLAPHYRWVQLFENKGAAMGCSNPHPHGQLWASSTVPTEVAVEDRCQREFYQSHGRPLLLDYAEVELGQEQRIVVRNDHWMVVVPFWAVWPYETLLLPRRAVRQLTDLTDDEKDALADMLKGLLVRYDNLFQTSFPYSMGWHGAPLPGTEHSADPSDHWLLHGHCYPPLLRSATVKKFMVGYEMLGEPQRDIPAELAADQLRQLSDQHYLQDRTTPC